MYILRFVFSYLCILIQSAVTRRPYINVPIHFASVSLQKKKKVLLQGIWRLHSV